MTDEIDRVSELTCQMRSLGLEKRDRGRWNGCWPGRERRRKGGSVVGTQPGLGLVATAGASGGGRPEVPHAAAAARFLLISVAPLRLTRLRHGHLLRIVLLPGGWVLVCAGVGCQAERAGRPASRWVGHGARRMEGHKLVERHLPAALRHSRMSK